MIWNLPFSFWFNSLMISWDSARFCSSSLTRLFESIVKSLSVLSKLTFDFINVSFMFLKFSLASFALHIQTANIFNKINKSSQWKKFTFAIPLAARCASSSTPWCCSRIVSKRLFVLWEAQARPLCLSIAPFPCSKMRKHFILYLYFKMPFDWRTHNFFNILLQRNDLVLKTFVQLTLMFDRARLDLHRLEYFAGSAASRVRLQ